MGESDPRELYSLPPCPLAGVRPNRSAVVGARAGRVIAAIRPEGYEFDADKVIDLAGACCCPGSSTRMLTPPTPLLLAGVDCSHARSVTEILDAVADLAKKRPGRQVLGHGWDELNLAEGRPPTAQELDRASGGAAVYLSRVDVHSAVVSGTLARAADLDAHEAGMSLAGSSARHTTSPGTSPASGSPPPSAVNYSFWRYAERPKRGSPNCTRCPPRTSLPTKTSSTSCR